MKAAPELGALPGAVQPQLRQVDLIVSAAGKRFIQSIAYLSPVFALTIRLCRGEAKNETQILHPLGEKQQKLHKMSGSISASSVKLTEMERCAIVQAEDDAKESGSMDYYGDIRFSVMKGVDMAAHWHSEVELLYVVRGTLDAVVGDRAVTLGEEDVLLINSGITHQVTGEQTLFALIQYPWQLFSRLPEEHSRIFVCSSAEDKNHSYSQVRSLLRELIRHYSIEEGNGGFLMDSLLLRVLDEVVEHYQVDLGQERLGSELRLQRMIRFVNQSYQHNLSLSKLAEELQISTSTLSRFFRKQTGYYFVDYVNQVRIRSAMKELAQSDKNITVVAVNNGFSNLSVFNRVFRDINGCSPSEYRRMLRQEHRQGEGNQEVTAAELRRQLAHTGGEHEGEQYGRRVQLRVNARSGEAYGKGWLRAINIGSAGYMTQANLQNHLLYLKEQIGFQYARVWNVFSRGMMICNGQRVEECSFGELDNVLDFMVNHRITPYLDLGKRPFTITRNEHEVVVQEYDAIEFASRRVWEHAVRSLVRHVVKRYGKEEVSGWIFELTNIPNGHRIDRLYGNPEGDMEYVEAFQYLFQVVREYVPLARVGGWGAVMDYRLDWQQETLRRLAQRQCPPDFYSVVIYPYETRGDSILPVRSRDTGVEELYVDRARQMLDDAGLQACSLYVCEWNCTISDRNYLNDSCYRSAYIARKVSSLWNRAEMMILSLGSDWMGNHYDTYRIVNGNMGLVSQMNIRKPAFFLMQFLKALGAFVISRGEHWIITRTDHFSYYILCFNGKTLGEQYHQAEEDSPLPSQLDGLYSDHEHLALELVLEQMPEGKTFTVKRRSINEREGSILPEWGRFHFDDSLEMSDIRYLQDACFPRMSMERLTVQEGELHIRERLQPNEVTLLHIYEHISG